MHIDSYLAYDRIVQQLTTCSCEVAKSLWLDNVKVDLPNGILKGKKGKKARPMTSGKPIEIGELIFKFYAAYGMRNNSTVVTITCRREERY